MNIFKIFNKKYPLVPSEPIVIGQDEIDPFEVDEPITTNYNYRIRMQDSLILEGSIWGSVGIWIEPVFDEEYFELTCNGHSKPNCAPGGDEFIKTFEFRPRKKGSSQIVIKHIFRGTIVKEEIFDLHII